MYVCVCVYILNHFYYVHHCYVLSDSICQLNIFSNYLTPTNQQPHLKSHLPFSHTFWHRSQPCPQGSHLLKFFWVSSDPRKYRKPATMHRYYSKAFSPDFLIIFLCNSPITKADSQDRVLFINHYKTNNICPVDVLNQLSSRFAAAPLDSPLLPFPTQPLTSKPFISHVRILFANIGLNSEQFSGHFFQDWGSVLSIQTRGPHHTLLSLHSRSP